MSQRESAGIKRLSEYIGQSYFDYLAGLPDLVWLMDESHRYRASAGVPYGKRTGVPHELVTEDKRLVDFLSFEETSREQG